MKVLVVSHNVFSETNNMGKTMKDFLSFFDPDDLAQLYVQAEVPTVKICKRYFRITDKDVLSSVLSRKAHYHIYKEQDIALKQRNNRVDVGIEAKAHQFGRKRTPLIYILRNTMWSIGVWKSKSLENWIEDFKPEVIFFASGDYVFSYKIVHWIAQKYKIPVIIWCCDDHYIGKKNTLSPLYWWNRKFLLKWAHKVSNCAGHMITICDKMKDDYGKLFHLPISILRISSSKNEYKLKSSERKGIVYAGNLGVNRFQPLLELGKQLKQAHIAGYELIDVYSGERNEEVLAQLTEDNGIRFHGAVPAEQIPIILGSAKYLLHVEAFDEKSIRRTSYSLSTKIGESLQSGACVIAYGPAEIASMEYLRLNQVAKFIEKPAEIIDIIEELDQDKVQYDSYVEKAINLACKLHSKQRNDEKLKEIFETVCDKN